jgi:hypothetical protein
MNRSSTVFLQVVIVLIGIGAPALMLWEPRVEGRNAHDTLFQTYFEDPIVAYEYTALFHLLSRSTRLSSSWGMQEEAKYSRNTP